MVQSHIEIDLRKTKKKTLFLYSREKVDKADMCRTGQRAGQPSRRYSKMESVHSLKGKLIQETSVSSQGFQTLAGQ